MRHYTAATLYCAILTLFDMGFFLTVSHGRADQNTGGTLLEFPMRTAMHGKSRVSSAISAIMNKILQIVSHQQRQLSGSGGRVVVTGWCKLKI